MEENEKRALPLKTLYIAMAILGTVLVIALLVLAINIGSSFDSMELAVEEYISSQDDATNMMQASDFLTMQVRNFAATGNRQYLADYFEEANETRRRDKAVENMRTTIKDSGSGSTTYLEKALAESNRLMQTEYYSFRLVISAMGYKLSEFPEEIRAVQLEYQHVALSSEEKMALARDIVYSNDYQSSKDIIYSNVSKCTQELIALTRQAEQENAKAVSRMLKIQTVLEGLLVVVMALFVTFTARLVVDPIERFIQHIRRQEPMEIRGVQEIRFMAGTYNSMLQRNMEDQSRLSYEANHDVLTGLYNRTAYENIINHHEKRIGFLLVDVDKFKDINDTYGHLAGDQVLQRVAEALKKSFRSEDSICRIGGDEFAVIMVNADSSLKKLVEGKLERMAAMLRDEKDGVPGVTLSIGVAFWDRENPEGSIIADADKALYEAKESGRNCYRFYNGNTND